MNELTYKDVHVEQPLLAVDLGEVGGVQWIASIRKKDPEDVCRNNCLAHKRARHDLQ